MPDSFWGHPLGPDLRPLPKYPALDFLRKVEVWQQPGTGAIPVSMPARDSKTLRGLLKEFRYDGPSPQLETQARNWLIGYRELSPILNEDQFTQLGVAIDGVPNPAPAAPVRSRQKPETRKPRVPRWAIVASVAVIAAAVFLVIVALAQNSHPVNPVQHGAQSQAQPQQVAPANTDLENLESDWGPWRQLSTSVQNPQSGAPAVLLLNQGGYYVSQRWTIPASSEAWATDLGGNVSAVDVQDGHALIEDADGNPWIVTINQPFVFAGNPGTILMIDPAGDTLAIPEAHAMSPSVRYHL